MAAPTTFGEPVTVEPIRATVPLELTTENPCTGEEVFLTGTASVDGVLVASETHVTFTVRNVLLLEGVDANGTVYREVGGGTDAVAAVSRPDEHGLLSFFSTVVLVSQGAAPNVLFENTFRTVLDPHGELVVEMNSAGSRCLAGSA